MSTVDAVTKRLAETKERKKKETRNCQMKGEATGARQRDGAEEVRRVILRCKRAQKMKQAERQRRWHHKHKRTLFEARNTQE